MLFQVRAISISNQMRKFTAISVIISQSIISRKRSMFSLNSKFSTSILEPHAKTTFNFQYCTWMVYMAIIVSCAREREREWFYGKLNGFSANCVPLIDSMKRDGNVPTQFHIEDEHLFTQLSRPKSCVFLPFCSFFILSFVWGGAVNWNAG